MNVYASLGKITLLFLILFFRSYALPECAEMLVGQAVSKLTDVEKSKMTTWLFVGEHPRVAVKIDANDLIQCMRSNDTRIRDIYQMAFLRIVAQDIFSQMSYRDKMWHYILFEGIAREKFTGIGAIPAEHALKLAVNRIKIFADDVGLKLTVTEIGSPRLDLIEGVVLNVDNMSVLDVISFVCFSFPGYASFYVKDEIVYLDYGRVAQAIKIDPAEADAILEALGLK